MLLSTHQTEDVAALCQRVVVMLDGAGPLRRARRGDLAAVAAGRVWLAERARRGALGSRGAPATARIATSATRRPAPTSSTPTLEDGYLLLVGDRAFAEEAA